MTPCDQGTADFEERFVNLGSTLPSNSQAAEVVKPGDRALHDPTDFAEAAAMFGPSLRDEGLNATTLQRFSMTFGVVSTVPVEFVGSMARVTDLPSNGWYRIQQGQDLRCVVAIGLSEHGGEGDTLTIDDQV